MRIHNVHFNEWLRYHGHGDLGNFGYIFDPSVFYCDFIIFFRYIMCQLDTCHSYGLKDKGGCCRADLLFTISIRTTCVQIFENGPSQSVFKPSEKDCIARLGSVLSPSV